MKRYKEIVTNLYIEPKNEKSLGSLLQPRTDVPFSVPTSSKKKTVDKKEANVRLRDDFFSHEVRQDNEAVRKTGSSTKDN